MDDEEAMVRRISGRDSPLSCACITSSLDKRVSDYRPVLGTGRLWQPVSLYPPSRHTRYTSRRTPLVCGTALARNGNRGSAGGMSTGSTVSPSDVWRLEGQCSLCSSRSGVNPRGQKDGARMDGDGIGFVGYRGTHRCGGGGSGARVLTD